MMRVSFCVVCMLWGMAVLAQQIKVPRVEQMPGLPQPYQMRDWKKVAADYSRFVFDEDKQGDNLPLVSRKSSGVNYQDCRPIYMDTYVGWNAHGKGSEAINVMPAVVTAAMFLDDREQKMDLAQGVLDFFNRKNGENVYLNGFSSKSGNDWWYDVMPNVYFYQLYDLLPDAGEYFQSQFTTVADRWLQAVYQLDGSVFPWTKPYMNYRAFDLISGKPLDSGVREPESAGSIGWILLQAYYKTGDKRYLEGAQLSIEYLNSLSANPSYELQLPYGVQAAAKMNALLGSNYDIEKMFNWCFNRGPLRGWGCIVGNWGGYDVSGLIGEANDGGNDYAFVMNGFQQMAALAPVAKYDKRFARAFAKWALNNANASHLFYRTGLPKLNQESDSYAWSEKYDPDAAIPFESMKESWQGASPVAMGDALKGKWATTNLSLYSGSSVGYLAAVVQETEIPGILQLDLNKTDFGNRDSYPTYLYYNPLGEAKQVILSLPEGEFKIYDAISEHFIHESVSVSATIEIPSDGVSMVTIVPAGSSVREEGNKLYAGEQIIDYHYKYNYTPSLRIKAIALQNSVMLAGKEATVMAELDNVTGTPECRWFLDSSLLSDKVGSKIHFTTPNVLGEHSIKMVCQNNGQTVSDSITFQIVEQLYAAPVIELLSVDHNMPVMKGSTLTVTARLNGQATGCKFDWKVSDGEITKVVNDTVVTWKLPAEHEGISEITCRGYNLMGESQKTTNVLVRSFDNEVPNPFLYFPFNESLKDAVSGTTELSVSGVLNFGEDVFSSSLSSLSLQGANNYVFLPNSSELNFRNAIALSAWIKPSVSNGKEQFIVSHGSWQDRYKISINPDMTLRWTIKTSNGIADVDYPVKLELNKFICVTALYTGFSSELYIDGELVSFVPLTGEIGTTTNDFVVGAMNREEMGYNYSGIVDELMMYDGILSPAFIKDLPYLHLGGGSSIGGESITRPLFHARDGKIYSESVLDFEVRSLTGLPVDNYNLESGVYLVKYVWEGKPAVSKVPVRN